MLPECQVGTVHTADLLRQPYYSCTDIATPRPVASKHLKFVNCVQHEALPEYYTNAPGVGGRGAQAQQVISPPVTFKTLFKTVNQSLCNVACFKMHSGSIITTAIAF